MINFRMVNLRGRLVPIVDLHTRLGFPQRDRDGETKILVVELKGQVVGLVTGSVSEVLRAQEETIEPAPDLGIGENAVQEVAKLEGRLLLLLSPEGLFSEEETKALKETEALEKTKALQSVEEKEKVAEG